MTMKKNRRASVFALALTVTALFCASSLPAFAKTTKPTKTKDDFGIIVRHIETQYHVHRQHRFVMGLAGFVVKFWHFAGVKNFKGAIFDNGQLLNAAADNRFDEVVRGAMDSGWQPVVQEFDRRSGERTYIYMQDLGKDMKVLAVVLETNEAVVIQAKVDSDKLSDFVKDAGMGRRHRHDPRRDEQPAVRAEDQVEVAAAAPQSWDGLCLMADTEPSPANTRDIKSGAGY
jgi:hypothetical protein